MFRTLAAALILAASGCGSGSSSCGGLGQGCCANSMCGASLVCTGLATKSCQHCGSAGEPCCAGSTCAGALSCQAGLCAGNGGDGGSGDMANGNLPDLSTSADGSSPCSPNGTCAKGPLCGDTCCGQGEYCDSSGINPVCSCGGGPACMMGASCVSNIPVSCGAVCCPPTCPP